MCLDILVDGDSVRVSKPQLILMNIGLCHHLVPIWFCDYKLEVGCCNWIVLFFILLSFANCWFKVLWYLYERDRPNM